MRRPPEPGDHFGEAQLGVGVAISAVLTNSSIVDVFL
jgi:hypothetical protein